jgi:hypothetical protein
MRAEGNVVRLARRLDAAVDEQVRAKCQQHDHQPDAGADAVEPELDSRTDAFATTPPEAAF